MRPCAYMTEEAGDVRDAALRRDLEDEPRVREAAHPGLLRLVRHLRLRAMAAAAAVPAPPTTTTATSSPRTTTAHMGCAVLTNSAASRRCGFPWHPISRRVPRARVPKYASPSALPTISGTMETLADLAGPRIISSKGAPMTHHLPTHRARCRRRVPRRLDAARRLLDLPARGRRRRGRPAGGGRAGLAGRRGHVHRRHGRRSDRGQPAARGGVHGQLRQHVGARGRHARGRFRRRVHAVRLRLEVRQRAEGGRLLQPQPRGHHRPRARLRHHDERLGRPRRRLEPGRPQGGARPRRTSRWRASR